MSHLRPGLLHRLAVFGYQGATSVEQVAEAVAECGAELVGVSALVQMRGHVERDARPRVAELLSRHSG